MELYTYLFSVNQVFKNSIQAFFNDLRKVLFERIILFFLQARQHCAGHFFQIKFVFPIPILFGRSIIDA